MGLSHNELLNTRIPEAESRRTRKLPLVGLKGLLDKALDGIRIEPVDETSLETTPTQKVLDRISELHTAKTSPLNLRRRIDEQK